MLRSLIVVIFTTSLTWTALPSLASENDPPPTQGASKTAETPPNSYLTDEDRILIEKVRIYSINHDIDLQHVEALECDLGAFRSSPKTKRDVAIYDEIGRRLNIVRSDSDQIQAQQILAAAANSEFDSEFIESRLSAGGLHLNLNFLERMVNAFSSSARHTENPVETYDSTSNRYIVTVDGRDTIDIPSRAPNY